MSGKMEGLHVDMHVYRELCTLVEHSFNCVIQTCVLLESTLLGYCITASQHCCVECTSESLEFYISA